LTVEKNIIFNNQGHKASITQSDLNHISDHLLPYTDMSWHGRSAETSLQDNTMIIPAKYPSK